MIPVQNLEKVLAWGRGLDHKPPEFLAYLERLEKRIKEESGKKLKVKNKT